MRILAAVFCKFKEPCQFKEIIKAKHSRQKGIYYVVCKNPEGCNQKTLYPVRLHVPVNSLGKFAIIKSEEVRKK